MDRNTIFAGWAVVGVLIVALCFRFYDIQHYPPGLFPDEAANGEDVLSILNGDWRPFYERGNGREGLFFYLQAASVALFGIGVWQMHVVSAVVGVLTVLATYFATRVWFGRLSGFFAALFLATSHWHVTLSRTGFRAILVSLFVALFTFSVGMLVQTVRKGRVSLSYIYGALAGLALGGGLYTYISFRVMVGVVLSMFLLLLLISLHPRIGTLYFRRYGGQMITAAVVAFVIFAPLGWYFFNHPQDIVGRAGQVSVFNPDLQRTYGGGTLRGTLVYSAETTALSFFVGEGDRNWRHAVAGYPLLNPLVGLLFLLGLAWTLKGCFGALLQAFRGQGVHLAGIFIYLLLLLGGMLLPVVTSAEGLPHGLRSVGLIFPLFMLAGTAGAVIVHWLKRRPDELWRSGVLGAGLGLVVLASVYEGALYFMVARATPEAHFFYRGDLTTVSDFIMQQTQEHPDSSRPFLVLDAFSLQTVHFLTHSLDPSTWLRVRSVPAPHGHHDHPDEAQHRYTSVEPESSARIVLKPGELIIFTQSTLPDADRYAALHGTAVELLVSEKNRFGKEVMRVYRGLGEGGVEGVHDEGKPESDLDA
jgi:4-amino-4-deoxy-L-arabinose transferase-like glycosyltransferase